MKNFIVSCVLIFAFLFGNLPNAKACGPFLLDAVFALKRHADFPLSDYAGGKTGIVPDSFDRMSLFIFYRQLNNMPLSKEEQKQIVAAMENEIFYRRGVLDADSENNQPVYVNEWLAARAKISSEKREIVTEKLVPNGYGYFTNCLPDAFKSAAKTLESRLAKHGNNANLREWLKGQDAVFANCENIASLPEKLGTNAPLWLRQDRAYQIAAAQFYQGKFAEARAGFELIAADGNSVWGNSARFVWARSFIREASFIELPEDETAKKAAEKKRLELLEKAFDALQKILKDDSMREFHNSAIRLTGLVKFRMLPEQRQKELAEILANSTENANIYNDLSDYNWLLSYISYKAEEIGTSFEQKQAEQEKRTYDYNYKLKLRDIPAEKRTEDLTDWIFTYKAADGFERAFSKWKETGKLQWFVAAISKTEAKSSNLLEILSEANKIKANSPAFATVRFHQVRLLLETEKRAEAKQKLEEVFAADFKNQSVSTQNRFFAQRMIIAENLEDFLKFAQRRAAIFTWNDNNREEPANLSGETILKNWEKREMFDMDAVAFLNEKVPLAVLREAALSPTLPEHLKKFLVVAVWTRAFILGNKAIENEFAPLMTRYAKEFTPLFSKYSAAKTPVEREAAALIAILRYPVLQPYVPFGYGRENSVVTDIDSIRGNWWCAEESASEASQSYDTYDFMYPSVYPSFLNAEQKSQAARELRQMISAGNSSTFLARRAVDFAVKNPRHPQTPEILHLAVRSTRYGCKDGNTERFSKQAFDILHKNYKNSPWTKKTPYWFGQ